MSTESEEERIARWERDEARRKALHRSRMRWWRHMREYVSMKRLFVNGLVRYGANLTPDEHPPWKGPSNWWPKHTFTGGIHE